MASLWLHVEAMSLSRQYKQTFWVYSYPTEATTLTSAVELIHVLMDIESMPPKDFAENISFECSGGSKGV